MTNILIKGYKSIKEQTITLSAINLIYSPEVAGKTNILNFFDFLKQIALGNLQKYIALKGGINKIMHKGASTTNTLAFQINHNSTLYDATLQTDNNRLVFKKEILKDNNKQIFCLDNTALESHLQYTNTPIKKHFQEIQVYRFVDTSENSPFTRASSVINDIYKLYSNGSNLPAILYELKQKYQKKYEVILKYVQEAFPPFKDFQITPNEEGYVWLRWQSKYSNILYNANDLPDTTIRFIALLCLLLQPNPPLFIPIDEPETGLTPNTINPFTTLLQQLPANNHKIIIATRSQKLIQLLPNANILSANLHQETTTLTPITIK